MTIYFNGMKCYAAFKGNEEVKPRFCIWNTPAPCKEECSKCRKCYKPVKAITEVKH